MRYFFVLTFFLTAHVAMASASADGQLAVLSELTTVSVRVQIEIDGVSQDPVCAGSPLFAIDWGGRKESDAKGNLSSQIETYVIRRMKFSGGYLRLLPLKAAPSTSTQLLFNIKIEHINDGGTSGTLAHYTVLCAIREPVKLVRDEKVELPVTTWSRSRSGFAVKESEPEAVKRAVRDLVSEFEAEYCKATPTWLTGKGTGSEGRVRR